MAKTIKTSDLFVDILIQEGVTHVYGIPGVRIFCFIYILYTLPGDLHAFIVAFRTDDMIQDDSLFKRVRTKNMLINLTLDFYLTIVLSLSQEENLDFTESLRQRSDKIKLILVRQ